MEAPRDPEPNPSFTTAGGGCLGVVATGPVQASHAEVEHQSLSQELVAWGVGTL